MKMVIIRGLPGSGKSTKTRALTANVSNSLVCSADDYFMVGGEYRFDPSRLNQAHAWCLGKATAGAELGAELIVVDNTNTQRWEYAPYVALAETAGYEVEEVMVGGLGEEDIKVYAARNTHGVPIGAIHKMAARFEV